MRTRLLAQRARSLILPQPFARICVLFRPKILDMKKQLLLSLSLLLWSLRLAAQWQHIPGPDGGLVINLDTDGSLLYALTTTSIYRSDDEGYHWQVMEDSHQAGRTIDRLVAENGVFYGKNADGEVLRSSDEGKTWQAVLKKPYPITAPGEVLHEVFAKGDTVLVSSEFTIYRSVDRGETWATTSDLFGYEHSNIFSSQSEFFSWGNDHIYRSSDGGLTWDNAFSTSSGFAGVGAIGDTLFALYSKIRRLIRSTDGFRTWELVNSDSISTKHSVNFDELLHAKVTKLDNKICFVFESGYYEYCPFYSYSTDGGTTWHRGSNGLSLPLEIRNIVSFKNHLVIAHRRGVSHSKDGFQTFDPEQMGLAIAPIGNISVGKQHIFVGALQTVYSSNLSGDSWQEVEPVSHVPSCLKGAEVMQTSQRTILLDSYGKNYYSEDEGENWLPINASNHNKATSENCLWIYFVGTLSKFCDGSATFEDVRPAELQDKILGRLFTFGKYFTITVSSTNPDGDKGSFLVFNESGKVIREAPPSPCPLYFPTNSFFYFDGQNILQYCGPNTYIFKENASTWESIYPQDWTTGIPLYHSRITAIATHQGVTWAALEGKGLFYTTDATGRFYPAQPQLPYPYPTAIAFRDNTIWVGTEGGGIYHMALPPVQAEAAAKPTFKCSPNPSDGQLHLEADLFFTDEILLEVLDVSGKLADSKTLSPGRAWDLNFPNLPQGLYILMLRTSAGTVGLKWAVH